MSPPVFNKFEGSAAGLKAWHQFLLFLIVAAATVSRRPDALTNPQFYSEDGAVWYAQAYNFGWLHSLTIPAGGYLNTLPRIVAGLALLSPLRHVPLVLNLFGIAIQALPVTVLLSSRCAAWGSVSLRAFQALLYVALPNSGELDVTITNAHWHLALVLCLISFAPPPTTRAWRVFDVAVLVVGGLTGPWALVLTPLVLVFWWLRRYQWSLFVATILAASALTQAAELATSFLTRPLTPLGANSSLLIRLIAGQVYVAAIWGQNDFVNRYHLEVAVPVFLLGSATLLYCIWNCEWERKLFIAFSLLIFAASLASPLIEGPLPRWQLLAIDKGARYWFFPMLALLWSLVWCATQHRSKAIRWFSVLLLAVSLRGVTHDWHYWPYKDAHFATYLAQFQNAPRGTKITIPVVPPGHQMELIKK